jgi:F-box protein 28
LFTSLQILDEVKRILGYIKTTPNLGRADKVTDELYDLCTMAMEYFKDHIEPRLPEISYFGTEFLDVATTYSSE